MAIRWLSRHDLSPAQQRAIRDLHWWCVGAVKDPVVFRDHEGLARYIREHADDFVYVVAGAPHYLHAALGGCRFGVFETHPAKRQDGVFGLSAVYWVNYPEAGKLVKVWENPDPMSDQGETLIPIPHDA